MIYKRTRLGLVCLVGVSNFAGVGNNALGAVDGLFSDGSFTTGQVSSLNLAPSAGTDAKGPLVAAKWSGYADDTDMRGVRSGEHQRGGGRAGCILDCLLCECFTKHCDKEKQPDCWWIIRCLACPTCAYCTPDPFQIDTTSLSSTEDAFIAIKLNKELEDNLQYIKFSCPCCSVYHQLNARIVHHNQETGDSYCCLSVLEETFPLSLACCLLTRPTAQTLKCYNSISHLACSCCKDDRCVAIPTCCGGLDRLIEYVDHGNYLRLKITAREVARVLKSEPAPKQQEMGGSRSSMHVKFAKSTNPATAQSDTKHTPQEVEMVTTP